MADFDSLPSAKDWKDKNFLDNETGQIFQSNGTTWTVMERPQGPSPLQQGIRGAISAASVLPAMAIPGGGPVSTLMRMGAESLFPMVAETAMQKGGLAPESGADIAMAGITGPLTRVGLGLPGVARGAARGAAQFIVPQQMREIGVGIVQSQFAGPKSQALFEIARRQGPVPTRRVINAIDTAIVKESGMSTPAKGAVKILENFKNKFSVIPAAAYDDLIDELQRLRQAAQGHIERGNNVTGVTLHKARAEILDAMDDISPAIKAANAAYRRESSLVEISTELRKQNAGVAVRNLLEQNPLVAKTFSDIERKEILDIADRMSRAGTGITMGAANRFIQASVEPVAEAMQEERGRALLKILMQNPRDPVWVNRWAGVILAQFGRGTGAFGSRIEAAEERIPNILSKAEANKASESLREQLRDTMKDNTVSLEDKIEEVMKRKTFARVLEDVSQ